MSNLLVIDGHASMSGLGPCEGYNSIAPTTLLVRVNLVWSG